MIHYTDDGYEVDILGKVLPYLRYKGYTPTIVRVSDLTHKGLDIDTDSPRFLAANPNYPLVVLKHNLFVVDGRHRLKKHLIEGNEWVSCYLIEQEIINLFKSKRGYN